MKSVSHIIWVCPTSESFYRSKGEVRCRPGSVIPKLAEQGFRINVLLPYDPTLLPKTKLSSARVTHHQIHLRQDYPVDIIKLTRGTVSPGIYMVKVPPLETPLSDAVFVKAALALAEQIKRPVDIFHVFDWEGALLPLFLELENGSRLFKKTKTFLNVRSMRSLGSFAPAVLKHLNVPETLFHPEGVEFYGRVSYLKAGLLFADGVGLVEKGFVGRNHYHRNGTGLEGVLDKISFKLRHWVSDRSVRAHLDVYRELLTLPKSAPLMPRLIEKIHQTPEDSQKFIESWGPLPPDRYSINTISFLLQSPTKAFAYWEWTNPPCRDYGLFLENKSQGVRRFLSRGLDSVGDYWVEVNPATEYVIELVGWTADGTMETLLRSRPLRTPRTAPSPNTDAVFIDVRNLRYFPSKFKSLFGAMRFRMGSGTSAWEWEVSTLPTSMREGIPVR